MDILMFFFYNEDIAFIFLIGKIKLDPWRKMQLSRNCLIVNIILFVIHGFIIE